MRSESIRQEVARMVRQAPFRPFVLSLENGESVTIGHPENIAFDPDGQSPDFSVITGAIRLFGTFDAVTSAATADSVEQIA
jgi:hypothetical protein